MTKQGRRIRKSTTIHFDLEVHTALVQASTDNDLSVNFLVNLAVKDMLPRLLPVDRWLRHEGDTS